MHESTFVDDLAVAIGMASIIVIITQRLKIPSVVGYLFAGLLVGPYIPIPFFADSQRLEALSEFGVVLVMFSVGMELRLREFLNLLPRAGLTVVVQVSALLWMGFTAGRFLGWSVVESLFLGGSLAISSTMVVTRVFETTSPNEHTRKHILGILAMQDIAAIGLIAALTGIAATGTVAPSDVLSTLLRLLAVLLGLLGGGLLVVPRLFRWLYATTRSETRAIVTIGTCFVFATVAEWLGYSHALGAFIAGVLVAESGMGRRVEHSIETMRNIFAAIFFVAIGMSVDPSKAIATLPLALTLSFVVVAGQFVAVAIGGLLSGVNLQHALGAALCLGQIGEFAFIIGGIGIDAGVVRTELKTVLVTVALVTAFTTPIAIRSGPKLNALVEQRLPLSVKHFLGLYEEWIRRLRAAPRLPSTERPIGRALVAILIDALLFISIVAFAFVWLPEVAEWVSAHLNISSTSARLGMFSLLLLFTIPLFVSGVRNTFALSKSLSLLVVTRQESENSIVAVQAFRAVIHLIVLLVVGAPTVAIIRPLTGGLSGGLLFIGVIAFSIVAVYKRMLPLEAAYQTGAAQIAQMLSKKDRAVTSPLSTAELLPGLDHLVQIRLGKGWFAVGRTLPAVNLRARCGATVVAIRRDTGARILPIGTEVLEEGDMLAVAGTEDSLAAALKVLERDG